MYIWYSDLITWASAMQGSVSAQELATNVSGAEELLMKHQVSGNVLCTCISYSK